jgi:hypothetical protein
LRVGVAPPGDARGCEIALKPDPGSPKVALRQHFRARQVVDPAGPALFANAASSWPTGVTVREPRLHDSAGGHLTDVDRHDTDRAVACRAALLEGPVCGLVIQCDLGLAGGRLSRCAGRPWHRGVDRGAAARSWLHPPHTRDNPGFGDRSFYSLVVDRAGPFGDLRGPGHPRERRCQSPLGVPHRGGRGRGGPRRLSDRSRRR